MKPTRTRALTLLAAILLPLASLRAASDDLSWMRGANYVPSYARNDIQQWMEYDSAVIDRELGYAEWLKLNTVRVFLNVAVFEKQPEKFLADFENFLTLADKHGIKVMPVIFDSCLDPQEVDVNNYKGKNWIPSPGFPRLGDKDWPTMEKFIVAVVGKHRDDKRVVMWDVMNEPESTGFNWRNPEGKDKIVEFVRRALKRVKDEKPVQPLGIGWAYPNNIEIAADLSDVLIMHCYADPKGLEHNLGKLKEMGKLLNKPVIINEFLARPRQRAEKALPVISREKVGWCFWELMIGSTQFAEEKTRYPGIPFQGNLYPDGTCFLPSELAAILNPEGFTGDAAEIARKAGFVPSAKVPKEFLEKPNAIEVLKPFTDESVTFCPRWTKRQGGGQFGKSLWFTADRGDTASKEVAGTTIELVFKHGPDCGIAAVTIDGKPAAIPEIDTYSKTVEWNVKTMVAKNLSSEKHTVVVTVTGRKAPAASQCLVQLVNIAGSASN